LGSATTAWGTTHLDLFNRDIADVIEKSMKILERGPTVKRVFERVVDYVATFIKGIAA
jgi:hypothetical protein